MVRGLLLWAAGNPRLERTITENPILSKATHRFIAGERLDEALEAAAQLNAHGIGGILDLLGEGVTDLEGANKAAEQYLEAAESIAARGLDATISIKLSQLAQTVDRDACVVNLGRILDRRCDRRGAVRIPGRTALHLLRPEREQARRMEHNLGNMRFRKSDQGEC